MDNKKAVSLINQIKNGDQLAIFDLHTELKGVIRVLYNQYVPFDLQSQEFLDEIMAITQVIVYKKALDYNEEYGVQFLTHVYPALKNIIIEEKNKRSNRGLKIPAKDRKLASKIFQIIQEYQKDNQSIPSTSEIQKTLSEDGVDVDYDKIEEYELLYLNTRVEEYDENKSQLSTTDKYIEDEREKCLRIAKIAGLNKIETEIYILKKCDALSLRSIAKTKKMDYNKVRSTYLTANAKINKKSRKVEQIIG